jgi:hypothetical protein
MSPVRINENNIVARLLAVCWILVLLLTATSFMLGSVRFAFSVLTGGLLAMANFYWLRSILQRALHLPATTANRFTLVKYVVRLAALALIIYLLIKVAGIHLLGLLLGLSVLVLGIFVVSIWMLILKGGLD